MNTTYLMMAGLIGSAILMTVMPVFAQTDEALPLDVRAVVTSIEREQGTIANYYTITVDVTNTDTETLFVEVGYLWLDVGDAENDCLPYDATSIRPGQTKEMVGCFLTDASQGLAAISFVGIGRSDTQLGSHLLPFISGECQYTYSGTSCQAVQRITHLIEDVEVEPVQCVAPPAEPAQTEDMPSIGSAVYHRYINNVVLTFDTPVTLADDWHENIRVQTETETGGMVAVDGLSQYTKNLMPDGSQIVWLTLQYSDVVQPTSEITDIELRIAPGTIMYGDAEVLRTMLLPPVEVVP